MDTEKDENMNHIDVVAAIIINDGQILCMQRGPAERDYVSYKYEFPGGKIESGETQTKALMRELQEEMNISLEIADKDFFMTVDHTYPDFQLTLHCYICRAESRAFVRKEHIDHQWVYPQLLKMLDWAAADYPIVEKLMETGIC